MANLSLKGKQIQTTTGRSPGLWEGSHRTPRSVQEAASVPGRPATQEHPSWLAFYVDQQFPQRPEPFKTILPDANMAQVIVGENTQTDCNKIKNNFRRK